MHPDSRLAIALASFLALVALPAQADSAMPAYGGMAQDLMHLDNGMIIQGSDVETPDGYTSGFRLTAGFTPQHLPRLDLGAEFSYRESDDVPVTLANGQQLLDTTSLGGSLVAGVRLGPFGLYAKSGLAEWQGDPVGGGDQLREGGGTARVQGFGARLQLRHLVSRLEFEEIDAQTMDHLNLVTASIHYPF
ncbi:outer membrane beta-barrel protein [Halomonas sp.]|uniref:outer membrane beta-barrel protein n=1 Tax=Halomonas sp. TaxID=1486246 RepID=UPI00298DADC7|nr:outer membrane beta-barrel protein [Halomonas sp.]MDW7745841.1 outer membrane beta-barrel protein [Halomonas sp.]